MPKLQDSTQIHKIIQLFLKREGAFLLRNMRLATVGLGLKELLSMLIVQSIDTICSKDI